MKGLNTLWKTKLLMMSIPLYANVFNPFPHMTFLQQTNIFCQKIKNLYNWMDNLEVENILSNFFFCHDVFNLSRLLQRRQKASIWGKGLRFFCVKMCMHVGNGYGNSFPHIDALWRLCILEQFLIFCHNDLIQLYSIIN